MNGNNKSNIGKKKKNSNVAVFLVAAVPVVLCIVMAVVIFSFTNKENDNAVTQDNGNNHQINSALSETENETNGQFASAAENSLSDLPTPDKVPEIPHENDNREAGGENEAIVDGDISSNDDSAIPDERPDSPQAPEITENSENDNISNAGVKDGLPDVDLEAWNLILVNPWTYLPDDFSVELAAYNDVQKVDKRIIDDLKAMVADMKKQGLSPVICSSYRTMEKQITLYNNQVAREKAKGLSEEEAKREAGTVVAVPGTSEHHTGLAVDIVALSYQILDTNQENTAEQKWLLEHCYDYGFILRYPNGKSDITGIIYEPWHYRYVGKEVASDIKNRGITFEEWLALYK